MTVTSFVVEGKEKVESNITNNNYAFQELSDDTKLLGCWVGTYDYVENDDISYWKFYGNKEHISFQNYSVNEAYYNHYHMKYYNNGVEDVKGLYFGPEEEIDCSELTI